MNATRSCWCLYICIAMLLLILVKSYIVNYFYPAILQKDLYSHLVQSLIIIHQLDRHETIFTSVEIYCRYMSHTYNGMMIHSNSHPYRNWCSSVDSPRHYYAVWFFSGYSLKDTHPLHHPLCL